MRSFLAVLFLFSACSTSSSSEFSSSAIERSLQRDDHTNDPIKACNDFIGRLKSPEIDDCICEADGRNLESQCTSSKTYCHNETGICGFRRFGGVWRFSTGKVEITGDYREVFLMTSGPAGTGRVRAEFDNVRNICNVTAGDEECQSCQLRTCATPNQVILGTTEYLQKNIYADCTNIEGGQVFDFCEPITVEDKESKFAVFDKDFDAGLRVQSSARTVGILTTVGLALVTSFMAMF